MFSNSEMLVNMVMKLKETNQTCLTKFVHMASKPQTGHQLGWSKVTLRATFSLCIISSYLAHSVLGCVSTSLPTLGRQLPQCNMTESLAVFINIYYVEQQKKTLFMGEPAFCFSLHLEPASHSRITCVGHAHKAPHVPALSATNLLIPFKCHLVGKTCPQDSEDTLDLLTHFTIIIIRDWSV